MPVATTNKAGQASIRGLMKEEMADPHVHCGSAPYGIDGKTLVEADLGPYLKKMKVLNISEAIVFPTPTSRFTLPDGSTVTTCIWEADNNGNVSYARNTTKDGRTTVEKNPRNPYAAVNEDVLSLVRGANENLRGSGRALYFAPILHPKLDRRSDLEKFLIERECKAVKIHGLATYSTPANVPEWAVLMSRRYDIPFILHTDFFRQTGSAELTPMEFIRSKNMSNIWAGWAIEKGVRAYLAHGVFLNPETCRLVNENDNMIVGIGPDSLINSMKFRLAVKGGEYLDNLFKLLEPTKIAADSDYAWNRISLERKAEFDWGSKERIIRAGLGAGLEGRDIRRILRINADDFFGL